MRRTTPELDQYLLGKRLGEQRRLQLQAQVLAGETQDLFDQIGVFSGASVVEIGCGPQGCLDLLAEGVGAEGSVIGIERNEESVSLAARFVAERKVANVKVIHGDGRSTGLPRNSFDFAIARLVLVNVPNPEQIAAEMAALVRPGGTVALYEADWGGVFCEPPLPAWTRLSALCQEYASRNEIDLFAGRKTPRMLREAALLDVQVEPLIRMCPREHIHRTPLPCFVENLREGFLAQQIVTEGELADLLNELQHHLDNPDTLVFGGLFFKTWGRPSIQQSQPSEILTARE